MPNLTEVSKAMDTLAWALFLAIVGMVIGLLVLSAVREASAQGAYPTLTVETRGVTVGDTGTQNLAFSVTLSPPSDRQVTVNVNTGPSNSDIKARTDFSQPGGPDYEAVTDRVLTFEAGETEKTVDVVVYGDTTDEPTTEGFMLHLSDAVSTQNRDRIGIRLPLLFYDSVIQ